MKFHLVLSVLGLLLPAVLSQSKADSLNNTFALPQQQLASPVPSPNGWDFFVQAAKAKTGTSPYLNDSEPDRERKLMALEREHVARNAEVFRLMQQGLAGDVMRPREEMLAMLPDNATLRELARTLSNKAHVEAADENWESSANTAVDIMQFGVSIMRGANLVGVLTGNAIESLGPKCLKEAVPHLNSEQLQKLGQRLEKIEAARPAYENVLTIEKEEGLVEMQHIMHDKEWQAFRARPFRANTFRQAFGWDNKTIAALQKISDEQIQKNYSQAMDKALAQARLPFAKQKESALPPDAFSVLLFGSSGLKRQRLPLERAATRNKLLLGALALHIYHQEHGHYPASLQALGGTYLPQIPLDPFDTTRPLGYRRENAGYVLYSIGPDGVDNNGTPIGNKAPDGKTMSELRRRLPLPESSGDIVADVFQ